MWLAFMPPSCTWPVMISRAVSCVAVSIAWLAKKINAVSMMANIIMKNGIAIIAN